MTVVAAAAAHFGRDLDLCLQRIATLIEHSRQAGAALLVLPDAALGGYLPDIRSPGPDALPPALEPDSEYIGKVSALAQEVVVCLGYCEAGTGGAGGPHRFNAAVCVSGDGVLGRHRKVHQPPGETGVYAAGESFAAFDTPAGRVGHADRLRQDVPRGGAVVHAQDCISANAAGRCLRTVHHLDHFTTPGLAACHERAITEPFGIICVSRAVAGEVAAGWGITATVIPNGVDAGRFALAAGPGAAPRAARAAWHERFGRYVLAVGGIEPRKGALDLLEAYALLRSSAPDVRLVIAGGETLFDYRDYRAAWDARAAALFGGTPDNAAPDTPPAAPVVLGPVAHDALPSLMAGASAFCFPSVREGFGLAALEALAAGVPVVTRSLPVLREVFGPAARFADHPAGFAGELRTALESPGELRAAGRALAARYTWQAAAAAHIAVYQRR